MAAPSPQVALISGGGSGHEPAHAGFVGRGMLTAAVAGNIYASPSVAAVLAAGDRLNFGLAAELARVDGIHVDVVFVADDCALDADLKSTGRRGVAGTVLVHKLAGGAAEAGASLSEVAAVARATAAHVRTFGVALSTCQVPGRPRATRLDDVDAMEIGLGIHGEPGAVQFL